MSKLPDGYPALLTVLKSQIRGAQIKAAVAVNSELIRLYWEIGRVILERQDQEGWGAKVIDRLAADLQREFPGMKGLSARNMKYMRKFAEAYPPDEKVPQLVAQIPWGHNRILLDRLKARKTRLFYIQKTIENGWSRAVLEHHIDARLFEREGKAITNFEATLPAPQSDLAQQMIRDPYHLDFLDIAQTAQERELEQALVTHMRNFLLELGAGFAFVGNQVPIVVDGDEHRIDLLFYHLKLRCYVVIELKVTAFQPEYAGKMNFYLSALDALMRHPDDEPSIGIILCRSKGDAKVKFALDRIASPIGVSTHKLAQEVEAALPSVEELEEELRTVSIEDASEEE